MTATRQQPTPITGSELVPVSALTYCNECALSGNVGFSIDVNFEGDDAVDFPDQNGTTYVYYFAPGSLTYDGSHDTVPLGNTDTIDVSGAPPIPEPNEFPALVAVFVTAICGRYWLKRKSQSRPA